MHELPESLKNHRVRAQSEARQFLTADPASP